MVNRALTGPLPALFRRDRPSRPQSRDGETEGGYRLRPDAGKRLYPPQHFLNFFPDPQGHGSLRPTPAGRGAEASGSLSQ